MRLLLRSYDSSRILPNVFLSLNFTNIHFFSELHLHEFEQQFTLPSNIHLLDSELVETLERNLLEAYQWKNNYVSKVIVRNRNTLKSGVVRFSYKDFLLLLIKVLFPEN